MYLGLLVLLQRKKMNAPEKFKTGPKNCYRVRNNYSAFTNTTKSDLDKKDSQRTTNNHLFFTLKYIFLLKNIAKNPKLYRQSEIL